MKVRKQAKRKSQRVVSSIWKLLKENELPKHTWFTQFAFSDYAKARVEALTVKYDLGAQDQTRLYASYKDGKTKLYRRFRRSKFFIFCYERDFHRFDHRWFMHIRDSEHFRLCDNLHEAMRRQDIESKKAKLVRNQNLDCKKLEEILNRSLPFQTGIGKLLVPMHGHKNI